MPFIGTALYTGSHNQTYSFPSSQIIESPTIVKSTGITGLTNPTIATTKLTFKKNGSDTRTVWYHNNLSTPTYSYDSTTGDITITNLFNSELVGSGSITVDLEFIMIK